MGRPQPPLLGSPLPTAAVGWPGVCGEAGKGKGEGVGNVPSLPGPCTKQFSPSFFLGQSGARSDKEFHIRRSGVRLNAAQTTPQSPSHSQSPITHSRHGLWLHGGRGRLMPPRPEGAPALMAIAWWPAAHCFCAQERWELDPRAATSLSHQAMSLQSAAQSRLPDGFGATEAAML